MKIETHGIVLRDISIHDIDTMVEWFIVETEWMKWNGPWDYEGDYHFDEEEFRSKKENRALSVEQLADSEIRDYFVICDTFDSIIGDCSSYYIDEQYKINDNGAKLAVGINLASIKNRGQGVGFRALSMLIEYYFDRGYQELFVQTWSGNIPMIKLAHKLGFMECNRFIDLRKVNGKLYDGLTFVRKKTNA